jgi:hypothetical protein
MADLGARDRLLVGDDRQRFQRRLRQWFEFSPHTQVALDDVLQRAGSRTAAQAHKQ